jgi:hypothetical protein
MRLEIKNYNNTKLIHLNILKTVIMKYNWKRLIIALVASGLLTKGLELVLKSILGPYFGKRSPFLWSNIKDQALILIPFFFNISKINEEEENLIEEEVD